MRWLHSHKVRFCVSIPSYIQSSENGIELSFCRSCIYPYGKPFVWSPDFKRQPFLIEALLKKYADFPCLSQMEELFAAKGYVPIRSIITNTSDAQKKQALIRQLLADEELMQIQGAESLCREAAVLADVETALLPQHVLAGSLPEVKEPYLELLTYWVCCDDSPTAPQLALIEKIAIDFSISSCIVSGFFKAALHNSPDKRKEHIATLLAQPTLHNPEIGIPLHEDVLLIETAQWLGKQNRATAAFKKRRLKKMRKIQLRLRKAPNINRI